MGWPIFAVSVSLVLVQNEAMMIDFKEDARQDWV